MNSLKTSLRDLKYFIILWLSQSFSALGSAMTNFALVIWSYEQYGSALTTALIAICSYAPYVLMSIFAGALSDRWNKKITMLVCDTFAAFCTICILLLLQMGKLEIWHIYVLNALNGLMNTVQQPSADVSISLLTPKKYYQKVSGMKAFSNSLTSVLTPVLATALFSLVGIHAVIWFDLFSFVIAFLCLVLFIKIPEIKYKDETKETLLESTKSGLKYLIENRGILDLILFLAGINLIASMYNAALPAMILSKDNGGEIGLGVVNASIGIATLVGSVIVSILPAPKSRVRVICNTLLFSMSTENFFLAFGNSIPLWSIGAVLGWLFIPMMGANMDVLFRNHIPIEMQGRVYAARNTLQFFTIPIGYFLGGFLVDQVFEPFMKYQSSSILNTLFGEGKGSGAAFLFLFLAFAGIGVCLFFRRDRHLWHLEEYPDKCSSVNANEFIEIAE
ncbi:MFS transporter [Fusibacter sp. 3D3]|uniref:MFS transporter n=1 Tax=Fusibacter sp. 3D3 TaxID=1048380 RepID=UPI000853313F|nr:MFS transporter [Fusibacter sp. 3D3]GAU76529.1 major facilitator superfamily MFS-1 [Fusibacter sp. 3D3]